MPMPKLVDSWVATWNPKDLGYTGQEKDQYLLNITFYLMKQHTKQWWNNPYSQSIVWRGEGDWKSHPIPQKSCWKSQKGSGPAWQCQSTWKRDIGWWPGVMWQFYNASLLSFTILTNPDHSCFCPLTPNLDLNICGLRWIFCLVPHSCNVCQLLLLVPSHHLCQYL